VRSHDGLDSGSRYGDDRALPGSQQAGTSSSLRSPLHWHSVAVLHALGVGLGGGGVGVGPGGVGAGVLGVVLVE